MIHLCFYFFCISFPLACVCYLGLIEAFHRKPETTRRTFILKLCGFDFFSLGVTELQCTTTNNVMWNRTVKGYHLFVISQKFSTARKHYFASGITNKTFNITIIIVVPTECVSKWGSWGLSTVMQCRCLQCTGYWVCTASSSCGDWCRETLMQSMKYL